LYVPPFFSFPEAAFLSTAMSFCLLSFLRLFFALSPACPCTPSNAFSFPRSAELNREISDPFEIIETLLFETPAESHLMDRTVKSIFLLTPPPTEALLAVPGFKPKISLLSQQRRDSDSDCPENAQVSDQHSRCSCISDSRGVFLPAFFPFSLAGTGQFEVVPPSATVKLTRKRTVFIHG